MTFNLEEFTLKGVLPPKNGRPKPARQKKKTGERFICGPIPLGWVSAASALPGAALSVGLALWYLAGLTKSRTVKLTGATLKIFGTERRAAYRALKGLEAAGLVTVKRHPGQAPLVTILDAGEPAPQYTPGTRPEGTQGTTAGPQ